MKLANSILHISVAILLSSAGVARAQDFDEGAAVESPADDEPNTTLASEAEPAELEPNVAPQEEEDEGYGWEIGLTYNSAFVWRGINYYANPYLDSPKPQRLNYGSIEPWFYYAIPKTNITLGYWSGYQTNGDNIQANIDAANGVNQQVDVAYYHALSDTMGLTFDFFVYFYPWSTKESAGADFGTYIEPAIIYDYSDLFNFVFNFSYQTGLQPDLDYQFFYLNAAIGKSFEFTDWLGLDMQVAYGLKLWTMDATDNNHDVQVDVGLPFYVGNMTLTPGAHWAWCNYAEDINGNPVPFADEQVPWGSFEVAYSF